eukprot:gene6827-13829_t
MFYWCESFILLVGLNYVQAFKGTTLSLNNRNLNGFRLSQWYDSSATISIPAKTFQVYELFSQFNEHPTWSPWLDNVKYDPSSPLSVWTLKTLGFTYSWKANTIAQCPPSKNSPCLLQWESIEGFANRGKVIFEDLDNIGTKLTLTVSFDLPEAAVFVLEQLGSVRGFVDDTLLGDLRRFKSRLLKELRNQRLEEAIKQKK